MAEPAARLLDEIGHTGSLTGFLVGLAAGAAVGVAVVAATVATGGAALAVVAAAGGAVASAGGGALFGQSLGATFEAPTGTITQVGSANVFINSRPAIRAILDGAVCSTHAPGPPKPIAQGAEMVLINGMPAGRKTSLVACGGKVSSGSADVFIGGPVKTLMTIQPEVPAWMSDLATAMVWVGGAAALGAGAIAAAVAGGTCALIAFGGQVLGGMAGGVLGGMLGGDIGQTLGGERGRIIGEFLGGMLGGFAGAKLGGRVAAGHPVDVASGELFTEETDFEIPGPLPLRWTRTWISSSTRGAANGGPMGEGWHHSFDMALFGMADGSGFAARLADGRYAVFTPPSSALASINPVEQLVLETNGGAYWITDYDGVQYHFGAPSSASGVRPLMRVEDANGNAIRLERVDGRLVSFTDSSGRAFTVESDAAGRILGVDGLHPDREGDCVRLASYTYDEHGNLTSAADARGFYFRYRYENHLLTEERRPAGLTFTFVWNNLALSRAARCVDTWGRRPSGEGGMIHRAQLVYDVTARTTWVTNGEGATWRHRWSASSQVEETTDPLGYATQYTFDQAGRLLTTTNPDSQIVRHVYDDLGRLMVRTDAGGTTSMAYVADAPGGVPLRRLSRLTGADGASVKFEFDTRGNLIKQTDATERWVQYLRDQRGLLLAARDAEGTVWRGIWSTGGELVGQGTDRGFQRRYSYDRLGRVVTVQRGEDIPLRLARDLAGDLVGLTRSDGTSITLERDEEGHLLSHRDALGRKARWRHDGLPVPVEHISADDGRIVYTYDSELNLVCLRNAKGESYQIEYDAAGRMTGELGFDKRPIAYQLDAVGHLLKVLDAGQVIRFVRDAAGRLLEKHFADGSAHRFAWDAAGRLVFAESDDAIVAYAYDQAGRMIEERQAALVIRHKYDARGRLAETSLPDGRRIDFAYGADDLFASVSFDGTELVRVERDFAGREVDRFTGMVRQSQEFDPQGRLVRQVGQRRNGGAVFARRYVYDVADQIVAIDDAARGLRRFQYDQCERLLAVDGTEPERFAVDPTGNVLAFTIEPGHSTGKARADRLLFHGDRKFEYDVRGNRVREAQGFSGGTEILYRYGPDDQLREVKETSRLGWRSTRFGYDALGRRVWKESTASSIASANQEKGRQRTEARQRTAFVWNGDVLLAESDGTDDPLATIYVFEPATFRPLARIRSGSQSAIHYYHLDHLGTPQELTNDNGQVIWTARHRAWGLAVKSTAESSDQPIRFQGQYHDVETGLHYNRFRYYNPKDGCFLHQDPIRLAGGLNLFSYAPNPLQWIDPLGLSSCKFPSDPDDLTKQLGIEPKVSVTPDGTRRYTWEPNENTRIRFESHPHGLPPDSPGFNPRHHGEHYHVETKTGGDSWSRANRIGNVSKSHPPGYTPGSGTGFLAGEKFPGA